VLSGDTWEKTDLRCEYCSLPVTEQTDTVCFGFQCTHTRQSLKRLLPGGRNPDVLTDVWIDWQGPQGINKAERPRQYWYDPGHSNAEVRIANDVRCQWGGITFCSTRCLRRFFNEAIAELERLQAIERRKWKARLRISRKNATKEQITKWREQLREIAQRRRSH